MHCKIKTLQEVMKSLTRQNLMLRKHVPVLYLVLTFSQLQPGMPPNTQLPRFTASLESLIDLFGSKGLSARDMVALSGSHTLGQAQCVTFRDRIYNNGSDINAGFARTRRRNCPSTFPDGNGNLAPLDLVTPNSFDNNYFKNLLQKKGLLESDQVLFSGGSTDNTVLEYSRNPSIFKSDFAAAMIKMGDIEPLTGSAGIIRRFCSVVN
ncbi:hypothetical protein DITRI_Ditri17bG0097400 [Diplodiscus trichospermus]